MERKQILKEEGDGDVDLNATIKEYWEWEAKLETSDQKFAEKVRWHAVVPSSSSSSSSYYYYYYYYYYIKS